MKLPIQPVCLTIAGLDPSGGAGIIADIKTFRALGCFGTAVATSLTFQNTVAVFGAEHISAENVRAQAQPVIDDFSVAAVKTGMLPSRRVIDVTARLIRENKLRNIVVDPVVSSTSGFDLIDEEVLNALVKLLFPISDLVTPNIPEAERIAEIQITGDADIERAARIMQSMGAANVLIKGGHSNTERGIRTAKDFLFIKDAIHVYDGEYIEITATHGTGCTLAAAITANLALGKQLAEAVEVSKGFVTEAIRNAQGLGRGNFPIMI